jgi:hypothetical protein
VTSTHKNFNFSPASPPHTFLRPYHLSFSLLFPDTRISDSCRATRRFVSIADQHSAAALGWKAGCSIIFQIRQISHPRPHTLAPHLYHKLKPHNSITILQPTPHLKNLRSPEVPRIIAIRPSYYFILFAYALHPRSHVGLPVYQHLRDPSWSTASCWTPCKSKAPEFNPDQTSTTDRTPPTCTP